MDKRIKMLFVLGVVMIGSYFIFLYLLFVFNNLLGVVCFNERNSCFKVEIADTSVERENGLMHRKNLDSNFGMIFIFPIEGKYGFWMKNVLFPLDIVWINSEKEVVFIYENAVPCETNICEKYVPDKDALYVLEFNAGKVKDIDLRIGDKIEIEVI